MRVSTENYDALIIGGGLIGCSIAWRLAQSGMRVVVIERGEVGREASQAAGGMLAPLAEADEPDDFFHLAVASRELYADFACELNEISGIDIEYRTEGTLFLALTEEDEEELDRRWQWQRAAGLNVKRLNVDCARKLEPLITEKLRWALKFPDDHQVNNRRLTAALDAAARNCGVEIRTQAEAQELLIESQAGQCEVRGVKTTRGEIHARSVVIAAGSWSSQLSDHFPFTIEPVRGQMIALESPAPALQHVIYSRRGYLIPRLGGLTIAGSTTELAGFDKRVTADGLSMIIGNASEISPGVKDLAVVETWAGLRPRSTDGLPILGEDPEVAGLVYAVGHYRNGVLLTPITAQAISELIINGESRVNLKPFSASRFTRRQAAGSES